MIEVLKSFEQEASRFDSMVLLVPGLVMVALGLMAWLAGMCLRRLMLGLIGAALGGMAGWLLLGSSPVLWALAAGVGAALGSVLPRLSTAVLLAVFGVAVAFVMTTRVHPAEGQKAPSDPQSAGQGEERLTVPESLKMVRVFVFDVVGRTKATLHDLERVSLVTIAAPGLVLLLLGLLFARLAGALTFSVAGTALICAGLVVLLIYKGSTPITLAQKQGAFFSLVLLGMAAFGGLEQLVLCPAPKRRSKAAHASGHLSSEESQHGWRDR